MYHISLRIIIIFNEFLLDYYTKSKKHFGTKPVFLIPVFNPPIRGMTVPFVGANLRFAQPKD